MTHRRHEYLETLRRYNVQQLLDVYHSGVVRERDYEYRRRGTQRAITAGILLLADYRFIRLGTDGSIEITPRGIAHLIEHHLITLDQLESNQRTAVEKIMKENDAHHSGGPGLRREDNDRRAARGDDRTESPER